jgi:hypothetical protein
MLRLGNWHQISRLYSILALATIVEYSEKNISLDSKLPQHDFFSAKLTTPLPKKSMWVHHSEDQPVISMRSRGLRARDTGIRMLCDHSRSLRREIGPVTMQYTGEDLSVTR